jgi:hypothetical protein
MNSLQIFFGLFVLVAAPWAIGWILERIALWFAARRARGLAHRGVLCDRELNETDPVHQLRLRGGA